MLKYLIMQVADCSVSFCHYPRLSGSERIISESNLKTALDWAVKEDLTIQILYPEFKLPDGLNEIIDSVDHADFVPSTHSDKVFRDEAEVVIFDSPEQTEGYDFRKDQNYILRSTNNELSSNVHLLKQALKKANRLNIVLTDLQDMDKNECLQYNALLADLAKTVKDEYESDHTVQLNVLTDRLMLSSMNNCNAGWESITLAPDGLLYLCPAFYISGDKAAGNLNDGLQIANQQLYRLDHSPICRICDAWQCRRCIWLNKYLTHEVNTPGRQQCVVSHLERAASADMLDDIRLAGEFMPEVTIPRLDYLDPFDKLTKKS